MPIFKIAEALKKADRNINDPSARCINCEYGKEENGSPLVKVGVDPRNGKPLYAHQNCPSARDRANEQLELESRAASAEKSEDHFAFANKFRYLAKNMPDNATVEATFPMLSDAQSVDPMSKKQVDANYQDGAPVPPKN